MSKTGTVASTKAERVQEPLAVERIEQRLKAERIQERLKSMPGWRLAQGATAVDRVRSFHGPHAAAAYAAFAIELAGSTHQPVEIAVSAGEVAITLRGNHQRGAAGGLTDALLDLAADLG